MARIINIDNEMVSIGMDDGTIRDVYIGTLNFRPSLGDEVEIYSNDQKLIVSKVSNNLTTRQNNMDQNVIYTGRKVNKTVYCLLAFFLGGIGGHKFYQGKVGKGFLYLFFCWTYIPLIISIFEFIIGLIKPADEFGNYIN